MRRWNIAAGIIAALGLLFLLRPRPTEAGGLVDTSPLASIPLDSPGLRCFCLVPSDDPLPAGSQGIVQERWNIGINWLEFQTGLDILAFPDVNFLAMPFLASEIRAESDFGNLPSFIFNWMETFTPWQPRSRPRDPREAWLIIVRGAGAFAGGLDIDSNSENIGWGIVADAVLSAWLFEAGLESNRCTEILGDLFPCSAHAQTGAMVHELGHAAFAAPHILDNDIMNNWWDFPDVPVSSGTLALIQGSPFVG